MSRRRCCCTPTEETVSVSLLLDGGFCGDNQGITVYLYDYPGMTTLLGSGVSSTPGGVADVEIPVQPSGFVWVVTSRYPTLRTMVGSSGAWGLDDCAGDEF